MLHDQERKAHARVEMAAVATLDALLARVGRVTAALRAAGSQPLDPVPAQLLLADLTLIAGLLRALNGAAADRLTSAVADLQLAREEVSRSLLDRASSEGHLSAAPGGAVAVTRKGPSS